jgi:cyclic beta-1,2-glucan synthetase
MLRIAIESVLGCTLDGGRAIRVRPCIPDEWDGFELTYRLPGRPTSYRIEVQNPQRSSAAVVAVTIDGADAPVDGGAARVPLADDGAAHHVVVRLGPATAAPAASK